MTETEQTAVTSASKMDKGTFAKHFTHRHAASLAGLTVLPGDISDRTADAYRAFHDQLHRWYESDLEHYHND